MAKTDKVENKDQKVEKSTKKSVKSSYSKKKKVKKNILNGIAYVCNQHLIIPSSLLLIQMEM